MATRHTDEEILALIADAARGLGLRSLSINQFRRATGVDPGIVKKRFGSWNAAVARAGLIPRPPHKRLRGDHLGGVYRKCRARPRAKKPAPGSASGGLPLGRLLSHEAMMFEPMSESGVILLFGALAAHLGFRVVKLDRGFPDMIAWRRMPQTERWEQVHVEFELRSANYKAHRHPLPGDKSGRPADLIICWRHNWPGCPIEVIELAALGRQGLLPIGE